MKTKNWRFISATTALIICLLIFGGMMGCQSSSPSHDAASASGAPQNGVGSGGSGSGTNSGASGNTTVDPNNPAKP